MHAYPLRALHTRLLSLPVLASRGYTIVRGAFNFPDGETLTSLPDLKYSTFFQKVGQVPSDAAGSRGDGQRSMAFLPDLENPTRRATRGSGSVAGASAYSRVHSVLRETLSMILPNREYRGFYILRSSAPCEGQVSHMDYAFCTEQQRAAATKMTPEVNMPVLGAWRGRVV